MNVIRKNSHRSRAEWAGIIEEQKNSALTAAEYCRKKGLSVKSFYAWRDRLQNTPEKTHSKFVEWNHEQPSVAICIHTLKGYRLEVSDGVNTEYVKALVAELDG